MFICSFGRVILKEYLTKIQCLAKTNKFRYAINLDKTFIFCSLVLKSYKPKRVLKSYKCKGIVLILK